MGFPATAHPVRKRKQPPVRRAPPVDMKVDRIGPHFVTRPVFYPRFDDCLFAGIVAHESRQDALQTTAVSVLVCNRCVHIGGV